MIAIDIHELMGKIYNPPYTLYNGSMRSNYIEECINNAPIIKITYCSECANHEQCSIEETFIETGIEKDRCFCGIGKVSEQIFEF